MTALLSNPGQIVTIFHASVALSTLWGRHHDLPYCQKPVPSNYKDIPRGSVIFVMSGKTMMIPRFISAKCQKTPLLIQHNMRHLQKEIVMREETL